MNKSGDTRNSQETWECYKPEYHYGSTQDWIVDHLRQKEGHKEKFPVLTEVSRGAVY